MKIRKKIDIPIFKTWWTVIITDDFKSALKEIGANCEIEPHHAAFTTSNDYLVFHIDRMSHGVIAHEALHASLQIFNFISQDPLKAEEVLAYTVEFLISQITELAKKHNIKL